MARADAEALEAQPIIDKGERGFCDSLFCCRIVGGISIPALERHHHRAIEAAVVVAGLGTVLALFACVGAFASGDTLELLPWVVARTPAMRTWVGVTHFCIESLDGKLERLDGKSTCHAWANTDCSKLLNNREACEVARHGRTLVIIPIIIGTVTYFKFLFNTYKRYTGNDSNCCKTMSCFSAFFGGLNFLTTLSTYWATSVVTINGLYVLRDGEVRAGIGFVCMSIAMVLKIFAGVIHLALPVARLEDARPEKAQ